MESPPSVMYLQVMARLMARFRTAARRHLPRLAAFGCAAVRGPAGGTASPAAGEFERARLPSRVKQHPSSFRHVSASGKRLHARISLAAHLAAATATERGRLPMSANASEQTFPSTEANLTAAREANSAADLEL
eukprot:CAMPEP_0175521380 /NCGR_PEP_ID=MMETSP0096-20121207/16995_1 /TAXON_ID=311494 /ORGANISM="Alexandrium monilatum, Strain CCMP3105" /LENGTH=133 /DNA_ID=CAMNT_0016823827 /DNA_START=148 /DNA_END=546 /DNA_ORIENTATION=-